MSNGCSPVAVSPLGALGVVVNWPAIQIPLRGLRALIEIFRKAVRKNPSNTIIIMCSMKPLVWGDFALVRRCSIFQSKVKCSFSGWTSNSWALKTHADYLQGCPAPLTGENVLESALRWMVTEKVVEGAIRPRSKRRGSQFLSRSRARCRRPACTLPRSF